MTAPSPALDLDGQLGALVARLRGSELNALAVPLRRARHVLLDTLGCALAGLGAAEVAKLADLLSEMEPGPVLLPGFPAALSVSAAAFLMAVAACRDEACEGLAFAHGRPGLHAAPVVLALARRRSATLGETLRALLIGYEVGGWLGAVLRVRPGMHVDGSWGLLGAAAAAAAMLGGTAAQIMDALRIAACQMPFSLYLPITTGSLCRNSYVGHGAASGIHLATVALAGMSGPQPALATTARLALGHETLPALVDPDRFLICEGYLKQFAGVKHAHYPAAAALVLCAQPGLDAAKIEAIEIRTYREALVYCNNRAPRTPIQAQFSLSHATAWALRHGTLDPAAYRDAAIADPAQRRLEALIRVTEDEALTAADRRGAFLRVTIGGRSYEAFVDSVAGDRDRVFDDAAVRAKFLTYAAERLDAETASRLADHLLTGALSSPVLPG